MDYSFKHNAVSFCGDRDKGEEWKSMIEGCGVVRKVGERGRTGQGVD